MAPVPSAHWQLGTLALGLLSAGAGGTCDLQRIDGRTVTVAQFTGTCCNLPLILSALRPFPARL